MEALRIVCNHKDIEEQKELKKLKQKVAKFESYIQKMNNSLYDILWVSRRPETKEEYDIDMKYEKLTNERKEELWNLCVETRRKYNYLFLKINVDPDSEFSRFIRTIGNEGKFHGIVGTVRALCYAHEDIFNDDDQICEHEGEFEGENCTGEGGDCACLDCGKCVFTLCKCEHALNQLEEDLFNLDLDLDS